MTVEFVPIARQIGFVGVNSCNGQSVKKIVVGGLQGGGYREKDE